jgi:ferredoxin, 2Fe-2S
MKETLVLRFLCNNQKYELNTYAGEYRNLMELIKDRVFVFGFGDCGGLGRCGTCLVNCSSIQNTPTMMDRNELTTLKKMCISNPDVHLSCQILIDEKLTLGSIEILDPE